MDICLGSFALKLAPWDFRLLAFAWDLSFGKTKEPTMENTSAPHGKQPPHGKHLGHTWKITGGHGKQRGAREKQGPPLETFTKCKCLSSKTFLDTFTHVLHTDVFHTFTHVLHTERSRGTFFYTRFSFRHVYTRRHFTAEWS